MRISHFLGATAAAAAAFLAVRSASANGRFPASNQIVFSPTNENLIVGRATWAILPSTDNGKTWGYLCEDALALPTITFEDPELGLTANNALIAGLSNPTVGLDVSPDLGCNWNCIGGPLNNQSIADIVVRPDTPHQVLALTGPSGTTVDAGDSSQVYESVDDGTTWNPLGNVTSDATVNLLTIDVSASDPNQIYVSGTRGYAGSRTASLFISSNKGETWVEHAIPGFNPPTPCLDTPTVMCPTESAIFIGAVDPTDPTRVYLRSAGIAGSNTPGTSRLYVTTDGGQTFTVPKSFTLPPPTATMPNSDSTINGDMLGFALSPDGSTVYIGARKGGLWTATKAALNFTQTNAKISVQCLAARQTSAGVELWACADEPSGFVFGKSLNGGTSFTPMMTTITSTSGLVACSNTGATSSACFTSGNASICSCSSYESFCNGYEANGCLGCGQTGIPLSSDAGSSDASSSDASTGSGDDDSDGSKGEKTPSAKSSSCGCSVVGDGSEAGFFAGIALLGIAFTRRRAR